MALAVTGQVGEVVTADGSQSQPLRQGRLNEVIMSELRGKYAEAAARGRVFNLVLAATTTGVAAGNINGAAAAASTQFALWNPVGSGVNVELVKFYLGLISGTPAGGPTFHSYVQGTPNNNVGTKGTSSLLGSTASRALGVASAAGTALTGSPSALITLRPTPFNYFAAALAAGANIEIAMEEVNGDIVLAPGTLWVPTFAAAGTTLLNAYGVSWMETPI